MAPSRAISMRLCPRSTPFPGPPTRAQLQDHLKGGRCELRHVSLHLSGDGEPAPFSLAVLDKILGQFIEFPSHHSSSLSFPNRGSPFPFFQVLPKLICPSSDHPTPHRP